MWLSGNAVRVLLSPGSRVGCVVLTVRGLRPCRSSQMGDLALAAGVAVLVALKTLVLQGKLLLLFGRGYLCVALCSLAVLHSRTPTTFPLIGLVSCR